MPIRTADNEGSYSKRLGAAIRSRRRKLGYTVDDIVAQLNERGVAIKRAAFYHWEVGYSQIPVNYLPLVAEILRTDVGRLVPKA